MFYQGRTLKHLLLCFEQSILVSVDLMQVSHPIPVDSFAMHFHSYVTPVSYDFIPFISVLFDSCMCLEGYAVKNLVLKIFTMSLLVLTVSYILPDTVSNS